MTAVGNVVLGNVEGIQISPVRGRGLEDFRSVTWDGTHRDAAPTPGSPLLTHADPKYTTELDLNGTRRAAERTVGCTCFAKA